MSHTDGTSYSTAASKKSSCKAREPNKLHEGIITITQVGPKGEPVAPDAMAKTYSKILGCILRNNVPIGCKDFSGEKEKLLKALHRSYAFPPDSKKRPKSMPSRNG